MQESGPQGDGGAREVRHRRTAIALVLDVSNPQTPVLWAAPSIDITTDIVKLYDQANPGTGAAPATAKPATPGTAAPRPPANPAPATPKPRRRLRQRRSSKLFSADGRRFTPITQEFSVIGVNRLYRRLMTFVCTPSLPAASNSWIQFCAGGHPMRTLGGFLLALLVATRLYGQNHAGFINPIPVTRSFGSVLHPAGGSASAGSPADYRQRALSRRGEPADRHSGRQAPARDAERRRRTRRAARGIRSPFPCYVGGYGYGYGYDQMARP